MRIYLTAAALLTLLSACSQETKPVYYQQTRELPFVRYGGDAPKQPPQAPIRMQVPRIDMSTIVHAQAAKLSTEPRCAELVQAVLAMGPEDATDPKVLAKLTGILQLAEGSNCIL